MATVTKTLSEFGGGLVRVDVTYDDATGEISQVAAVTDGERGVLVIVLAADGTVLQSRELRLSSSKTWAVPKNLALLVLDQPENGVLLAGGKSLALIGPI